MTTPDELLAAALALHDAGLCVLPAATDGSKRPAVAWQQYQDRRPSKDQLRQWLTGSTYDGIGIVAGEVSGGLEMTELEGRAVDNGAVTRLFDTAREAGDRELIDRLVNGYCVASPSGGIHLIYWLLGLAVPGNTKLAATADHVTLAETRGEGGWMVTAPSFGRTHPNHRPWAVIAGTPATIPTLTADERDRFHALIRTLDERPVAAPSAPNPFAPLSRAGSTDGISPGDDFNARTTWADVLTADGWRQAFVRGEVTFWRRPGKDSGISATTGYQGDWLYPFTSSTSLEPERTYTRFGYVAAWSHGGDHHKAAEALQRAGYGKKATVVQLPVPAPVSAATADGMTITLPDTDTDTDATVTPLTAAFGLTDVGNARLFVAQHGHRLRYIPERGKWLVWTGARWMLDDLGEHMELAKAVLEDAARLAVDKAAVQHFTRSMTRRGVEAMVGLARTDPSIRVSITDLDAYPAALCTPGGIVDLRTGELRPSDPGELHTRSTPITPAAMPTPRWDQFLADTYGGDTELIGYVQRLLGYSATGEVTAHVLPFLYGPSGQNGKTVLMEVLGTLLGDYATTAPGSFLTHGPGQHEAEIARLHGARFVACSETEPGARFAEAKVKMLTGGDRITARFLYGSHFSYDPTAKLWLMANDRPSVASGGNSFWRRLRLINHPFKVPEDRRIDGLAQILVREEGPGILAWVLAGARAFYAAGLGTPASVLAATAGYATDEDDLGRFIAERLIVGPPTQVGTPTNVVTAAYHRWCADEGVEPANAKRFGMELRTRCGAQLHRTNGRRFYLGVALAAAEHESVFAPLPPNPSAF